METQPVTEYMRFQLLVISRMAPLTYVPMKPGMAPNVFITPKTCHGDILEYHTNTGLNDATLQTIASSPLLLSQMTDTD